MIGLFTRGAGTAVPYPPSGVDEQTAHRRGMRRGVVFAAIWLWPLVPTFRAILEGHVHPVLFAVLGLIAFIPLYLTVVVRGFGDPDPVPKPRDHVMLGLLTVLGLALALAYGAQPGGWTGLTLYLAAAGAALYPTPWAHLWLVGCVAALVGVGHLHGQHWSDLGDNAFNLVMAGALVLVVRRLMRLVRELRTTRDQLAHAAVEQERLRFARDLHDLLGHSLSVIVVKAEVVRRLAERDPAAAAREAGDIEQIGRTALTEVRQAITGYRTRAFTAELAGAGAALADAGIDTTVKTTEEALPPQLDDAFAWVVREAATNVIRHSGAGTCVIALSRPGQWQLEVRDDGRGGSADPTAHGNGLRGLAERLALVGGVLAVIDLSTSHGGGFVLRATAPEAA
ncbi:sensor histidine kinase [Catellatospora sp. TT07R-123]|uniref:sensor histidine kinase n=1 Tax=Catellatospora sp. TT07R-123 TaxID=2733863 RepID=UPI001BB37BE5|nr:sensor histidine kinase [Catellatospora sp. TT07R-123]